MVLEAIGISKTYGGTRALDNANISVRRGEIHGIVGANGSGKSTFVKVLAGVVRADPGGRLRVGTIEHDADRFDDPRIARDAGIRFVHQDPCVFGELTVEENLAIGSHFETGLGGRVDWRALRRRASATLSRFELDIDPAATMRSLRSADRTMIAVARALQDVADESAALLVLDEPTAALPQSDVERLFDWLQRFAAHGQTIVIINHRLREVLRVVDRLTVLRDGRDVATCAASTLDETSLAELIVGGSIDQARPARPPTDRVSTENVALEVEHLRGPAVEDVSMRVRRGEIVGVAGLRGDGQTEVLRMLFGDIAPTSGEIRLCDRLATFATPREAMEAGVAFVPGDRVDEAVFADLSVQENVSASVVRRYWRRLRMAGRDERDDAEQLMRSFRVRLSSLSAPIVNLSGGNQQKVIFARWLRRDPVLLLLDEPSQGVDVGAHADIERLVRDVAGRGTAVVLVSSDLGELVRLCDRVLIMRSGRIDGELRQPFDETELTRRTIAQMGAQA